MKTSHIILLIAILVVINPFSWCDSHSEESETTEPKTADNEPLFELDRYLVNMCEVLDSEDCTVYKYTGKKSEAIPMAGDESGYGGFSLCDEGARVTFKLNGDYEALTFNMGHDADCLEEVGVVTVHGDGRKLLDEKVSGYEPPRQYTVNISGVDELTFRIAASDIEPVITDAVLWKSAAEAKHAAKQLTPATAPKELVKDIKPYYVSNYMTAVTPDEHHIMLNRQTYEYGLRGNMNMALIGTNKGSAYFNLRGQYSKLSFIVGCHDDLGGAAGAGWVTVKADGKIIEEIEVREGAIARQIALDITSCQVLSFHTEQTEGDSHAEMAQIMVYPEGQEMAVNLSEDGLAPPDARLKDLPDVCKLISNITPYQVVGKVEKQIYTGSSEHITFSMGGDKFSEGIILYQTASFWDGNLSACATFDMGNEFDYISFTAGYIGKSWNMNNDCLMVYADDELVFSTTLVPTYPNQDFVVPINKCRMLRFCNAGCGNLDVAAFGIGDIVAYRGKVVENDLFVHPRPECPDEIDLIDLGKPYIHYISGMGDSREEIIYDGSTKKNYYELNGERIYKGFLLQTSTHFSLDFGVLGGGNGTDSAAAGAVGATAVGASFVATGAAVGGASVGATLAPMAAFLMLAAGGEAVENSCAAFNTYGEYNSVTFKIGCLSTSSRKQSYLEHLMIGADQEVIANIGVYESMQPQEITVPINGCEQLMFWLANTNGTSAKYVIYDVVVRKGISALEIPVPCRMSLPQKREVKTTEYEISREYERYSSSYQSNAVDGYLSGGNNFYRSVCDVIDKYRSNYIVYTYYLDTSNGPCKAIQLRSGRNEDSCYDIPDEHRYRQREVEKLAEMRSRKAEFMADYQAALNGLYQLETDADKYRNYINEYRDILDECFVIVEAMYQEKCREYEFMDWLMKNSMSVDGVQSTDECVLCPLTGKDILPDYPLQNVRYFDMKE
jgi:hypothetical protein